jgi:hypothetical protein
MSCDWFGVAIYDVLGKFSITLPGKDLLAMV